MSGKPPPPIALEIDLDDAIRRAVLTGRDAGGAARLTRLPGGRRVYVVDALPFAEARAAMMCLASAAGVRGGGA